MNDAYHQSTEAQMIRHRGFQTICAGFPATWSILHLFLRLDMLKIECYIGHIHADYILDVFFTVRFTSSVVSGMLMPGSMKR